VSGGVPDGDSGKGSPDRGSADSPATEVYGAAPERTALAWQRTGLSVVIGCFLVFVASFRTQILAVGIAAGLLGLAIAALSVFAFPVNAYLRGQRVASWPLLLVATVSVVALGVLGTVAGVLTMLR
jgi:uncharacterized membrane protein YidH (DUF202 family)